MATGTRRLTAPLVSFGRLALIVTFTGVEVATLGVWLALVEDAAVLSRAAGVGIAVLVAGLVVEHFLTDLAVNGTEASFPLGTTLFVSATEALLWAGWLVAAERLGGLDGVLVAGAALAVLLVPQHTVEDNGLRQEGLFSGLLDAGTVGFSLVEAAGATVWLALVFGLDAVAPLRPVAASAGVDLATLGLGALAVALLVEHVMGVRFSRRSNRAARSANAAGTRRSKAR